MSPVDIIIDKFEYYSIVNHMPGKKCAFAPNEENKRRRASERENGKGECISFGPPMAAAWVPICKKGVAARN